MKKYLIITLILVTVLLLAACNSPQSVDPTSTGAAGTDADPLTTTKTPERSKKVAGVVFFEDQFMKMLQNGFADAAKNAGYEFFPGNTNNDAAKEVEMLDTYVMQDYAGVAIAPLSPTSSLATLEKAAGNGLVVGVANSSIEDADWMTGCYTSDDYQLGQMTGEACAVFAKERLNGSIKVGILEFRPANAEMSAARKNGFLEVVKNAGVTVEVLADEDAWEQDKAITIANDIMTAHSDINVLWAANEGGTIGAAMAVKNAGLAGEVFVFGTDASEQTALLLQDSSDVLQALTGQDPYTIGIMTMESVIRTIEGLPNPDKGKKIIVPGFLLSRTDPGAIDEFLEQLKNG